MKSNPAKARFSKYRSGSLRIWHWLNFVAIVLLMLTAYLRKGWMNTRAMADIIQKKSEAAGAAITQDTARQIGIQIRNQMWDWHYIFGFCLTAVLVLRLIVFLRDRQRPKNQNPSRYVKFVHAGYFVFYALVFYMCGSGLLMYFKAELGLAKDFVDLIKEVHEFLLWFFAAFTVAHIFGVVLAEFRGDKGLVSEMISGRKQ